MREIKFRGLRKDGKGWIYGQYLKREYPSFIDYSIWTTQGTIPVIPESIGQFTGLTDKNGRDIYEGDKLKGASLIYIVEWNSQNTKFCINPVLRLNKEELDIVEYIQYDQLGNGYYSRKDLEIIGNIHETP